MADQHFLDLADAGGDAIAAMIGDAIDRKTARKGWPKGKPDADQPLADRVLAMVFEKSSTRTRVSFDIAIRQLGGTPLILDAGTTQLGRGESVADTARVLGRMADAIMIRTDDHAKVEEMAKHAGVPVINGLTDRSHPCQIVADLLTIIEHGKPLPGLQLAWLGDCNNVMNSLVEAAGLMKFDMRIGTPPGYVPDALYIDAARAAGSTITVTHDAAEAAADADVVVADTWISMGQEHAEQKLAELGPYQVNAALMAKAKPEAKFLHCLPAHVGEEVSAEWETATKALGRGKDVRFNPILLIRIEGARTCDAGLNFIKNQHQIILVSKLAQALNEFLRSRANTALALHWLHQEAGSIGAHRRLGRFQIIELNIFESGKHWGKALVHLYLAGGADRGHGPAVKCVIEGNQFESIRIAATVLVIGACSLDCGFHRLGARIGEEHRVSESLIDQTLGQDLTLRAAVKV